MASRMVITCDVCNNDVPEATKYASVIEVRYSLSQSGGVETNIDCCSTGCVINWLSKELATKLNNLRTIEINPKRKLSELGTMKERKL